MQKLESFRNNYRSKLLGIKAPPYVAYTGQRPLCRRRDETYILRPSGKILFPYRGARKLELGFFFNELSLTIKRYYDKTRTLGD